MQTLKAIREAEAYDGPSIVIAYAPCIAHGINMTQVQAEEKKAVDSGYWPMYRFNPQNGDNPLTWETPEPKSSFQEFLEGERRYRSLATQKPEVAKKLFKLAEKDTKRRFEDIKSLLK